jgi:hypothetical protein
MSFSLNPSNTITSVGQTTKSTFLLLGGTNVTPPWAPYPSNTPPAQQFVNIFNYKIDQQTTVALAGKLPGTPTITKINNFLEDSKSATLKTYACGDFTIGTAKNLAYIQNQTWFTLGLTFPVAAGNQVTCMAFNDTIRAPTQMYIGGRFTSVTDSSSRVSNADNFAIINLIPITGTPNLPIYSVNITVANPPANYIINSLIKIGTTIYVGGTTALSGGNVFFASYNITTNVWTTISNTFPGTINTVVQITPTLIALGGQFTSLGTATNCNNIVFYDISVPATPTWKFFGAAAPYGVSGVAPVNAPYPSARVFAITSLTIEKVIYIFVGGYFVNAGGILCNSIAIYNNTTKVWTPYVRSGITGVLYNNYVTKTTNNPGVVFSLVITATDSSNIVVGGLFVVALTPATPTVYTFNLFRITTSIVIPKAYNQYYGKTITV